MKCTYEPCALTRALSGICRALDTENPFQWLEFAVGLHLLLFNRDNGIFQEESDFACFGVTELFLLSLRKVREFRIILERNEERSCTRACSDVVVQHKGGFASRYGVGIDYA